MCFYMMFNFIGESSSGRTPDFDSGSRGSNPCSPAILITGKLSALTAVVIDLV